MDLQTELVAEYDREIATTRKILNAIPDDADFTWKASPKNMTLGPDLRTIGAPIPGSYGPSANES